MPLRVLKSLTVTVPDRAEVLLATRSPSGIFYAGITFYKPSRSQNPYATVASPLTKGFREDRVPATIITDLYLNAAQPVKRHNVERADHAWIHGRDVDSNQVSLTHKHAEDCNGMSPTGESLGPSVDYRRKYMMLARRTI